MSDFVYVISYWDDYTGEWIDAGHSVVMNDEHAEEKIRGLATAPESMESDFNKLFSGEVGELWVAKDIQVERSWIL